MAAERGNYEQERDRLIRCVEDAHEALRLMVGVDGTSEGRTRVTLSAAKGA